MIYTEDGLGKFYVESSVRDGEGIRILKRFLLDTIVEIAKESANFIEYVEQSPFIYSERQLHTIIAPAIARMSDCFIMESPVDRKWSLLDQDNNEDSRGWVDYWCSYKDFSYYLEIKKRYISYTSKNLIQKVKDEWQVAWNQLEVIQDDAKAQAEVSKKVFKIAVEILTVYIQSKDENKLTYDIEGLLEVQQNAIKQISEVKEANWSCLWVLHDSLVEKYSYSSGHEVYPALLYLLHIE